MSRSKARFAPGVLLLLTGGCLAGWSAYSCAQPGGGFGPQANPATGNAGRTGPVNATIRVEAVTGGQLGQLVVNQSRASVDYQQGETRRLGPARAGMTVQQTLPGATAVFDRVIRVRIPGANSLRISMTVNGKTATESAQGTDVIFFIRRAPQGRGAVLVGSTELYQRGLDIARDVAIPPERRPRRFVMSTLLRGPGGNPAALNAGLESLSLLGINTVEIANFGVLSNRVEETAARYGITRFIGAAYKPPVYFSWGEQANEPRPRRLWSLARADELKTNGVPLNKIVYYQIAEEPTWYFPGDFNRTNSPNVQERFRKYLQENGVTAAAVGASSWAQVRPIMQSQATDLESRRLFYWSMQFFQEGAAEGLKYWGEGVRNAVNPNLLTVSNMYNRVNRTYFPAPNQKAGTYKVVGPNTAMASMSWFEIGRRAAPTAVWSEDWDYDDSAPLWSYYGAGLRAGMRENAANSMGGFIVGRRLGNLGQRGAKLKALALIGQGAKYIQWYNYGPEPFFPEFSWSDQPISYQAIAAANSLIGAAEDVLYPAQRRQAAVAMMVPTSAWYWDKAPGEPTYDTDFKGLYFALTHSGYPVDFVDEAAIERGDLDRKNYQALYVAAPNVSAQAQRTIANWVRGGGLAVFSGAEAAGADEYNTPTNILDQVRGVKSLTRDGAIRAAAGQTSGNLSTANGRNAALPMVRGATNMQAAGARPDGRLGSGGPVSFVNEFGQGRVYSFTFRPGATYWRGVKRDINHVPINWNPVVRAAIAAPVLAARIPRPVETNEPLVETSRMESPAGTAIVLLNWTNEQQPNLQVRVRNAPAGAVSLASGAPVQRRREGGDLIVTLDLKKNDADVLLIRP